MPRLPLALLVAALVGCGPHRAPLAGGAPPAEVPPVHFRYGGAELSGKSDLVSIGEAVARLRQDPRLVLVVVGYADPSGDAAANLKLSQARAEAVKTLVLEQGGLPPERVVARGMGEVEGAEGRDLRRVDFLFARENALGIGPDAEKVLARLETGAGSGAEAAPPAPAGPPPKAGAPAPKAGATAAGPGPAQGEDIVPTGLSDVDAVFTQVQGLLDSVRGARAGIARANVQVRAVLGLGEGAELDEALAALKTEARGAVKVKMVGPKPTLAAAPGASPKARQAVSALNDLIRSLVQATARLAEVPKQAQAIIAQAKTIPSKLPTMLKDAGMGLSELPATLKAVRHNLKLTASVPKECAAVGKEAAATFKAVGGAFR